MLGRCLPIALIAWAFACSEQPPTTGQPTPDSGSVLLCDEANPCPSGLVCLAGICEAKPPIEDSGVSNEDGARMQVCTPDGCEPPWSLNFGGSRIGVTTSQ